MERLTERRDGMAVIPLGDGDAEWDMPMNRVGYQLVPRYLSGDAANRLAAYEDTGLEPEQVRTLQADVTGYLLTADEYRAIGSIERLRDLAEADIAQFSPGQTIWVADRNAYGVAYKDEPDVSGYMFIAAVGGYAIASCFIDCMEELDETMKYLCERSKDNFGTVLYIFALKDCYGTRAEAEKAMEEMQNET